MKRSAKALGLAVLKLLCLFIVTVVFGTAWLMFVAHLVGYVPYSDRPGPGWYGWFPVRSIEGILEMGWFFLSWALFAAPFVAINALVVIIPMAALRLSSARSWLVAVLAALVLGYAAQYLVAGMGWYIAISQPAVIAAAFLGVFTGAILPLVIRRPIEASRAAA